MFKTLKKEQFSVAYIKALAAPLGLNPNKPEVDDDSVDIFFMGKDYPEPLVENPQVHFQLKCTQKAFHADGRIHFSLPRKNYDDLRSTRRLSPSYLIIMSVPSLESEWIEWSDESLLLRHAAYWLCLRGMPPVADPAQEHITVYVPRSNRFDVETMKKMMDASSEEKTL